MKRWVLLAPLLMVAALSINWFDQLVRIVGECTESVDNQPADAFRAQSSPAGYAVGVGSSRRSNQSAWIPSRALMARSCSGCPNRSLLCLVHLVVSAGLSPSQFMRPYTSMYPL